MISLKYVTPKKQTVKIKGITTSTMALCDNISQFSKFVFFTSGKKAATEEGGELHVLIKEAKNLIALKPGGTSDSFVKG